MNSSMLPASLGLPLCMFSPFTERGLAKPQISVVLVKPTVGKSQSPWPPEPKPGSAEVGEEAPGRPERPLQGCSPMWGQPVL